MRLRLLRANSVRAYAEDIRAHLVLEGDRRKPSYRGVALLLVGQPTLGDHTDRTGSPLMDLKAPPKRCILCAESTLVRPDRSDVGDVCGY